MGLGMALAGRLQKLSYSMAHVILSDGECNEDLFGRALL